MMPERKEYGEQTMEWLEQQLMSKRVKTTQPGIRMVLYGKPGVGKTVFGATLPDPLILAVEKGVLSIADRFKQLHVIGVDRYDELKMALAFLRKDAGKTYKSVVIDSLSEARRKHMDDLLELHQKTSPTLDLYLANTTELRRLIRDYCDLTINVLFICSSKAETDDETGARHTGLGLTRQLAGEMPGYVDVLGYMGVKVTRDAEKATTVERFILTEPTDRIDAKDRSGKLPRIVQPVTFETIQELIFPPKPAAERKPEAAEQAPPPKPAAERKPEAAEQAPPPKPAAGGKDLGLSK
jgi:hypothetical protein